MLEFKAKRNRPGHNIMDHSKWPLDSAQWFLQINPQKPRRKDQVKIKKNLRILEASLKHIIDVSHRI